MGNAQWIRANAELAIAIALQRSPRCSLASFHCMNNREDVRIDGLLAPWLRAGDDAEAEQHLSELLALEIDPVVRGVIRYKLRCGGDLSGLSETDDIRQQALVELLGNLRECRNQPEQHPISDVRGLAATITYRACYRWLRRRSPQRHALRNRLQYVLTRQP